MKKEKLRAHIFDAALQIVTTQGLSALNTRKIAQKSGCSLGSIYTVFQNLYELQLHIKWKILEELFALFYATIEQGIEKQITLNELLKQLAYAYIQFGRKRLFHWKAVFEHAVSDSLPDWYTTRIQNETQKICHLLAHHFNLDAAQATLKFGFFWASIHGMISILLNRKFEALEDLSLEHSIDQYIDYSIRGLLEP